MLFLLPYNSAQVRIHGATLRHIKPPTKIMASMQLYVPEEENCARTIGARAVDLFIHLFGIGSSMRV